MDRPNIPKNVERKLWAESGGICANPSCKVSLLDEKDDNNSKLLSIADKAHIVPYSETQDDSFDNLVLLCKNCHAKFDSDKYSKDDVINWKKSISKKIEQVFAIQFKSFMEMARAVKPLLMGNKLVYEKYYVGDNRVLWEKFEKKILTNNVELVNIFNKNKKFFHKSNVTIIEEFVLHAEEFAKTRGEEEKIRTVLFPPKINSIFGIEPVNDRVPSNASALQNFIKHLIRNNIFVKLDLLADIPYIEYIKKGKNKIIKLNNKPYIDQLFWNLHCYRPKTTDMRMESLLFFINFVKSKGLSVIIPDPANFLNIIINDKKVKLEYEYCITVEYLKKNNTMDSDLIINLFNFGPKPVAEDAKKFAADAGIIVLGAEAEGNFYRDVLHKLR